jgi:hypothetical protein
MVDLATPRAERVRAPRRVDGRLVAGVLLVLVAVVVGARVFASADKQSPVWVARHALVPGEHVASGDLEVGRVRLGDVSARYAAAGGPAPLGYLVTRYVGAGEVLPVGALSAGADAGASRLVTVPVLPGHLPPGLGHGDVVDVYVTAKVGAGADVPAPVLVIGAVPVESRESGARAFSGSSTVSVVLAVPADRVASLVHAVESGTVDLVQVPHPERR